jgi:hypothetical protein
MVSVVDTGVGGDGVVTGGGVPGWYTKVRVRVSSSQDGGDVESQAITVKGGEILTVSDGDSRGAVPEITPLSERRNPRSYCSPGRCDPVLTAQ